MSDNYLFALIITFLLGLNFQHSFRGAAVKIGLVDTPCKRKNHAGEIPLFSGSSMGVDKAAKPPRIIPYPL